MLKNCANFIISWVDSHIIDYPTAKLLFGIYIISLVLLLFFSPVLTIILLLGFSIYFCYKAKYKNIIKIWGFFIVSWYLLFTAFLIGFDAPIVIGNIECGTVSDETRKLYFFIKKRYCGTSSILESFCLNTFFFFGLLSSSLGFPIYIPSVLKGILFILKLILKFISGGRGGGPSVDCSPEDGGKGFSSKSKPENSSPKDPLFGKVISAFKPDPKVDTLKICKDMQNRFRETGGLLSKIKVYREDSHIEGKTIIRYGEAYIPFLINKMFCFSEKASEAEIAKKK